MTMSSRAARTGYVLLGSAALTLSTVTAAGAENTSTPEEPAAPTVEWPPPDSGGAWLPVPPEIAMEQSVEACDSTVTVSPDVSSSEYHSMHQPDGTVRVEYRGTQTLDVTRESDGAMLEDVDTSGPGYEIFSGDGSSITFSFEGPSMIGAFDPVEAAAFAARGLPPLFYYESGNTTERVVFSADPEAETIESAEFETDTALGVRDVCDMLDEAAH